MKRVLIVDDERDITEALGELLQDKYEVELAFDGSEALDVLLDGRIDAVVLDLMMPTSGETLMTELKSRGIEVPVIFASSATNLEERAKRSGAADYIAKPFDFDHLEAKLEKLLGERGSGGAAPPGGGQLPVRPTKGPGHGALGSLYCRRPAREALRARAAAASSGCRGKARGERRGEMHVRVLLN